MSDWVSQQDMLDFLDRLKHVAHPQYHVIDAIIDNLKEAVDETDVIVELVEDAGCGFDDRAKVVDALREHNAMCLALRLDQIARELDGTTPLQTLRAVLKYAAECEAQVFALQELCAAAGLINANDHKTDVLPLLRMFLPVE